MMADDLAVRIEAALTGREETAQLVIDLLGAQVNIVVENQVAPDKALADFMDENSPSSVLRLITGMRQMLGT